MDVVQEIRLIVKGKEIMFPLERIKYFRSWGNYVKIITDDSMHISQIPLHHVEELLPLEQFIRIHKSFIINMEKISRYTGDCIFLGGEGFPIGKTYKHYVKVILSNRFKS